MRPKKLGIIGLGWFGKDLAHKLKVKYDVRGTQRSQEDISKMSQSGIGVVQLDLNYPINSKQRKTICDVDLFLLNVPPGIRKTGTKESYLKMMSRALSALNNFDVKHLIFVSSTGVFGIHQHEVDETTLPEPDSESGKGLFEAEKLFRDQFKGHTTVLRPAGLVGKERHPVNFLSGRKEVGGQLHPVNLVHLEDLIGITEFLLEASDKYPVVHAVTNHHPRKSTYYSKTALNRSIPFPEFNPDDDSKGRRVDSIYHGDKNFPEYVYSNLYQLD